MRLKKKRLKCVLQGMDNVLLGSGFIVRYDEDSMDSVEVENENGLPTISMGTQVKVVVYGMQDGMHVFAGNVYYSTKDRLRVDNMVLCAGSEQRKTYRVTINGPGMLLVYVKRPDGEYGDKLFEEPVTVRDISMGGCLIEADKRIQIGGRALKLRLTMYETIEEIELNLKSAREKSVSETLYGMSFRNVNQRQEQVLDRYLLRVQQDQIRRSRRLGY